MGTIEWMLLIVLSILWGGSFFFSKVALRELPPLTVVLCRVGLAAIALAIYLAATGHSIPKALDVWTAFAGMGLLNNLIPFSLLFWGQTTIASGLASILNATTPVFSLIVAHLLTKDEKMSPHKIVGIALGIAGVVVLVGAHTFRGDNRSLLAMLACLGAALSYGFAGVFGRRFRAMRISPVVGAFGQLTATSIVMIPIVTAVDAPWTFPLPGPITWGALLGLALLSTALAYVIFFRILAVGGAINASLVTLLIPASAIILGSAVLGEQLAPRHLAGLLSISLGLIAIDGRAWRWVVARRR